MTKLEAINEMFESMGDPPVLALETGQGTNAGRAEAMLDQTNRRVQTRGIWYNELSRVTHNIASVKLTVSITGTFKAGEIVEQETTEARGIVIDNYASPATEIRICPLDESPAFNGSDTITGDISNATATVSDIEIMAHGVIQLRADTLAVEPLHRRNLVNLQGRLFDKQSDSDIFTEPVVADVIVEIPFEQLPESVATFIAADSAVRLQRAIKRGQTDHQFSMEHWYFTKATMDQQIGDLRNTDLTRTRQARNMKGWRRRIHG